MFACLCVCVIQICMCGCVNKVCHIVLYFLICLIIVPVSKLGGSRSTDRFRSKMAAVAGVQTTN